MDHDLDPWKHIHIYKIISVHIWDTAVAKSVEALCYKQVWYPMVLEFFIDIILLATLCMALGLTQPLTEMSTWNISLGIKAAGASGWQPYHLHVLSQNLGASTSWNPQGLSRDCTLLSIFSLSNQSDVHMYVCEQLYASCGSTYNTLPVPDLILPL
jgi:hypothetical protein